VIRGWGFGKVGRLGEGRKAGGRTQKEKGKRRKVDDRFLAHWGLDFVRILMMMVLPS